MAANTGNESDLCIASGIDPSFLKTPDGPPRAISRFILMGTDENPPPLTVAGQQWHANACIRSATNIGYQTIENSNIRSVTFINNIGCRTIHGFSISGIYPTELTAGSPLGPPTFKLKA